MRTAKQLPENVYQRYSTSAQQPPAQDTLRLTLLLLLFTSVISACLGANNDCPPAAPETTEDATTSAIMKIYPACTGQVSVVEPAQDTVIPEFNQQQSIETTGVALTRITQNNRRAADTPTLRHHYSRRQAWNADETLLDLNSAIVDAQTWQRHPAGNPLSTERSWSRTDPALLFGIRHNPTAIELASFNVKTLAYTTLHRFEGYRRCTLGHGEGNLSNDDSRIVVTCSKIGGTTDILSFDIEQRQVLGILTAKSNLNWASISPSGNYVVVENNQHPDPEPQLLRYSIDMKNETLLMDHPSHGDLALDDDGNDIYVMIGSKQIYYIRIKDRVKVRLPIEHRALRFSSGHVSCQNFKRPGWCYISAHKSGHIGAVKLGSHADIQQELAPLNASFEKGPNAYEHWATHHSSASNYAAQAKASVSPSGRQIIFSSDWYATSAVEEFVLSLP